MSVDLSYLSPLDLISKATTFKCQDLVVLEQIDEDLKEKALHAFKEYILVVWNESIKMSVSGSALLALLVKEITVIQKGDAESFYRLALVCQVAQETLLAVTFLEKAASKEHIAATHALHIWYRDKMIVCERGYKEAEKWERKALRLEKQAFERISEDAESSKDPAVMYDLGIRYLVGNGTEKNTLKSISWLFIAANKKYARAMRTLGMIYTYGIGVSRNPEQAKEWFTKASRLGGQIDPLFEYSLEYRTGLPAK